MGHYGSSTQRMYLKDWLFLLGIAGFLALVVWANSRPKTSHSNERNHQYKVCYHTIIGHNCGYCHHYERDGNAWKFFDENGDITGEVTPSEGMTISVTKIGE